MIIAVATLSTVFVGKVAYFQDNLHLRAPQHG